MPLALEQDGRGDPLVLVHGVGTSRVIWARVRPLLAAERRVVLPDVPGFGDSPPAGPGFRLEQVADSLAAGLSDAGVPAPFDLVGHSLGGAVALALANRHPELVRRLVLLAPAGFSPRPRAVAEAAGAAAVAFVTARRLAGRPLAGSATGRRLLLAGAVHDGGRVPAEHARAMIAASRGARRMRAGIAEAASADLYALLAELQAPLGLMWGARDRIVPPATISGLLARRPGTPVVEIQRAGHVPQMERPEQFAAELLRLLGKL